MHKIEDIKAMTIPESNSSSITRNDKSTVQLSLKSHCYTWTINDFSHCLKFRNCQFNSPTFSFQNTQWRLRLCVITENDKVKNMKIMLQNNNKIDCDLYFKNNISIVGDDGKVLSQADVEFCSTEDNAVPSAPVYLVSPWGSESIDLPNKLTVRSEFSSLISETKEDAEIKPDDQNPSCSKSGKSVIPPPKHRTRRTVSSRTRSTSSSVSEEEKFLITFAAAILFSLLVFVGIQLIHHKVLLSSQVPDAVSSVDSNEINDLILDSTRKLYLIAEVLNLTSVKEKSREILAFYSKMYNGTDHVQPATKNMTESLASEISSFVASEVRQFILGMSNDTEKSV